MRVLAWMVLFVCSVSHAAGGRPPNIVLILADDLGIGDTGAYGGERIRTPNIDALARSGIRALEGYVSHPVCSPSRAGLLTGRNQARHGWEFNPAGRDRRTGMSLDERTMADALRDRGYATGMVGKWHLGQPRAHHPLNRGFDEYFGVLEGGSTYIDSRTPGVESAPIRGETIPTTRANDVLRGFDVVAVDDYLTDVFTSEAVAFIERQRERPFFLYLSHIAPHTPLQSTARYLDRYRHIEDPRTRVYAAMVSALDDGVGLVVNALKSTGAYDNTLVVFLSDNGCADYVQGACSNAPFAGYKRFHQEGGIRVPFIVSWPSRLARGVDYAHPISALDLVATFTAAAGRARTTEDSVNLLPYLTGARTDAPHRYLYWRSGPTIAIRNERFKLVRYQRTELRPADLGRAGYAEAAAWQEDSAQLTLLYDLLEDPGETRNLAAERPEIVRALSAEHARWAAELPAEPLLPPVRSTIAEFDGNWAQLYF